MSISALLALALTQAPAPPALEEAEDLLVATADQTEEPVVQHIQNTGVLLYTSQVDQECMPSGASLAERSSCNAANYVYDPFDGDERDASQCSGYFVTDRLFLTAAHCLEYVLRDPKNFSMTRIARGYTSPTSKLELFSIGLVVHSSRLGSAGTETDWVLIEARPDPASCAVDEDPPRPTDERGVIELVDAWLSSFAPSVPPLPAERRAGYLISSPLGFHLHVSRGTYEWTQASSLPTHEIPAWPESSGGPIFDATDGSLVGILQGINHLGRPYCTTNGGSCTVRFPMQSESYAMSGRYVPIHSISSDLSRSGGFSSLDPSNSKQAQSFVEKSTKSRTRSKMKIHKLKLRRLLRRQQRLDIESFSNPPQSLECIDCDACRKS